jgi:putative transposase
VCVICCDGLTALPEAIEAVLADAWVQTCVVRLRSVLRRVDAEGSCRADRRLTVVDAELPEDS